MQLPESLYTIAEISIALAGFSGLVVALRKNRGPLSSVEKYRLQILLILALGALFLSFLPELLAGFSVDPALLWPFASTLVAMYSVVFVIWWLIASRRIARVAPEIFSRLAFARMVVGHAIVVLLLLAVASTVVRESAGAIYVLAMIWYLVHAAQQFIRMLFVVQTSDSGAP